jgi:hypothetical protein
MMNKKRYTPYLRLGTTRFRRVNLRILKFKRPKWGRLKKALNSYINKRSRKPFFLKNKNKKGKFQVKRRVRLHSLYPIYNSGYIYSSTERWARLSRFYKESLATRTALVVLYNRKIPKAAKIHDRLARQNYIISSNFYEITSLLLLLGFCSSFRDSRRRIDLKLVNKNSQVITRSCALKAGDAVEYCRLMTDFKTNFKRFSFMPLILPHLEIDLYSQSAFVVVGQEHLTFEHISFLTVENLSIETAHKR